VLVSVIVVNLNGSHLLPDCLGSLSEQTTPPAEIVVADNGSCDDSCGVVKRYGARWEPLGENLGFAKANNLAAARSKGEIFVFVNNDMRFRRDFLEELTSPLRQADDVFAADGVQLDWSGGRQIHGATYLIRRGILETLRRPALLPLWEIAQQAVDDTCDVLQACAANMAVHGEMFRELGGFDERLPAGWEDTEICWRAWLRGWRTVFTPQAVCWHKVGATSDHGVGVSLRYKGSLGGRLVFATKHLPAEAALACWFAAIAGAGGEIVQGRWRELAWRCATLREFAGHLPAVLAERRWLYRAAATTHRAHARWLSAKTSGRAQPNVLR
jgi:hypothetical protein